MHLCHVKPAEQWVSIKCLDASASAKPYSEKKIKANFSAFRTKNQIIQKHKAVEPVQQLSRDHTKRKVPLSRWQQTAGKSLHHESSIGSPAMNECACPAVQKPDWSLLLAPRRRRRPHNTLHSLLQKRKKERHKRNTKTHVTILTQRDTEKR